MTQAQNNGKITMLRQSICCPICQEKSTQRTFPFCSQRCSDHDLANWLGERYAIQTTDDDADRSTLSYQDDV